MLKPHQYSHPCRFLSSFAVVLLAHPGALAQTEQSAPSPKAVLAEARTAIAAMNQAQRSYYSRNQFFANTVSTLQAEGNFQVPRRLYNFAINTSADQVMHYAIPRSLEQHVFVGAVFLQSQQAGSGQSEPLSIICKATTPGNARPADPTFKAGRVSCGEGSSKV